MREARIGFSRLPKADVILSIEGAGTPELLGSTTKSLYDARVIAIAWYKMISRREIYIYIYGLLIFPHVGIRACTLREGEIG